MAWAPACPSPTLSPTEEPSTPAGPIMQRHLLTVSGQSQAKPDDICVHSDLGVPSTLLILALLFFNRWICHYPLNGIQLSGEKERALPWLWCNSQIRPIHTQLWQHPGSSLTPSGSLTQSWPISSLIGLLEVTIALRTFSPGLRWPNSLHHWA